MPSGEANRVASAISEIAAACGEAWQEGGNSSGHASSGPGASGSGASAPGPAAPGAAVRAAAAERARELAHVDARFDSRIYDGQPLHETVVSTIAYLRECRLPAAAAALERETAAPR